MKFAILILLAFILDMVFGDPIWLPHPICFIGNFISKTEKFLRPRVKNQLIAGFFLVIIITTVSFSIPYFILSFFYKINFYVGFLIELFFCFQIFAAKSLKKASLEVYSPLIKDDILNSRIFLSYIVGRDTQDLNKSGIIKATVETVAENTTDGVIAPLIFMALGGAPLAFFYKAINTMDSMVGYKNDEYILFGRCAAKLDDIVNFIPARISAFFMIVSAYLLNFDGKNAIKIYLRDRKNHKSPNSAQTESVCAGALNIQLAGDASYFGNLVKKPTIGDKNREILPEDIKKANKLMYVTSILTLFFTIIARSLI
ncbi:MAG: adenosylcobinamide-phosphate synthase CbiB [Clostridia bacterium]